MQVTQEVVEQLAGIVREWAGSSRNASCALWSERELARAATAEDDLDAAQENKLRRLAQLAGVHTGMDVLEVGSGFGGMLDYLVETAGARSAHGLEPDPEMCRYVKQHAGPGVSVENIGWEDFVPDRRFDAVVGVSVLEYAARSPSPSPQEEIDALREFFRRAHTWTVPAASLVQEVTIAGPAGLSEKSAQGERNVGEDLGAPPGKPPELSHVLTAARGLWELVSVETHRHAWARTMDVWLARARRIPHPAVEWQAQFLDASQRYFELERDLLLAGERSVAHLAFRRLDGHGADSAT